MAAVQKKRGAKNQSESSPEKSKNKQSGKPTIKKLIWYVSSNWME
jgi:hypothetical protein